MAFSTVWSIFRFQVAFPSSMARQWAAVMPVLIAPSTTAGVGQERKAHCTGRLVRFREGRHPVAAGRLFFVSRN